MVMAAAVKKKLKKTALILMLDEVPADKKIAVKKFVFNRIRIKRSKNS
jgi:hypothetical protein